MRGTWEIVIKEDNSLWALKYKAKPDDSGGYAYTVAGNPQKTLDNMVSAEFSDSRYESFILALTQNGTLWGWGENHYRQLGAPPPSARWPDEIKSPEPLFTDARSFNAGNNITLIVDKNNQLWGMGQNGQRENEFDEHQYSLLNLPTGRLGKDIREPKLLMRNVLTVGSNWYAVFAVKTDNSLWVWGDNRDLGISDALPPKYIPPTKIAENIKDVRGGGFGGFAFRDTDDRLWVRGGLLLKNYPQCLYLSRKRSGAYFFMDDVADYAVANSTILAVKKDGAIWGCGDSKYFGLEGKEVGTAPPFMITLPSVPQDAKAFFDSSHDEAPKE
jgi:alpha-tubulin suppressor-like RCC1 family protein